MRPQPRPLTVLLAGAMVSVLVAALAAALTRGPQDAAADPPPSPRPAAAPAGPPAPAMTSNFPDPDMIKVGGTYFAYATNDGGRRVPMATAPSPAGPWTRLATDALPSLGKWARDGRTWAPEVASRPDGSYVLYYTARHARSGAQCIAAATSAVPSGPFSPAPAPLICPRRGDAIDAAAFVDADLTRYLLYKADGSRTGRPSAIYLQRLNQDGLQVNGPPQRILVWDSHAEPTLIEAPALVRRGGRYVLLYAAGVFYDDTYRTGYATAATVAGPYTKAAKALLSTEGFDKKIRGPGGADVVADDKGDHLVFHGIQESLGGKRVRRGMYVTPLAWAGARPIARGSPVRYEAESARRDRATATSTYVTAINGRLEFTVYAPTSGPYRLRITYRAPTRTTQTLTVNNGGPTTLTYQPAAQWQPAPPVQITLRTGWNTLRIHPGTAAADLDHIEVI